MARKPIKTNYIKMKFLAIKKNYAGYAEDKLELNEDDLYSALKKFEKFFDDIDSTGQTVEVYKAAGSFKIK